ncbi:MAG: metallopeptidase TldD-related protein [Patescibacteria group bacterium]
MKNIQIPHVTDPVAYLCAPLETDSARLCMVVGNALHGAQDGELFLECEESERLSWKDGRIDGLSYGDSQGFGLRRVNGMFTGYAISNRLTLADIVRAGRKLALAAPEKNVYCSVQYSWALSTHYQLVSPLGLSVSERLAILVRVDEYLRRFPGVINTNVSLSGSLQTIMIIRADGYITSDVRPLVRMDVGVQCEKGNKREWGSVGFGGRTTYNKCVNDLAWVSAANEAYKQSCDKLEATACPSGEMPVVLGPGWPGIILHEAVGHGLEGDAVRKGESVFAPLLNERVASDRVSVVDDGTVPDRRGSLNIDDEGTPTQLTLLIDRGKLVSFMHDRMSARHFGVCPTGNGRRESYEYAPIVRMTNTMMLSGEDDPEEIMRETSHGLYMPAFSGGQVDTVTGKFVFESPVAYLIEGGRVTRPVIGATLIGNCVEALKHIDRVGFDACLDKGIGSCGKDGQSVPVGVGQPTLRMSGGVVVGGTEINQS